MEVLWKLEWLNALNARSDLNVLSALSALIFSLNP